MSPNSLTSTSNALAADARSLNNLKLQAGQNTPAAIKESAKQLESLFMRELIKSMRQATMKSGLLDNSQGDLGADLLDQQMAVQMSGLPGGLSDLIAQQLTRQLGSQPSKPEADTPDASTSTPALKGINLSSTSSPATKQFVTQHGDTAAKVERSTGIPASFMIGQAGHESGWGQREIKMPDGSSSFNLFGIKAGSGWHGKVAEVTTTEYSGGVPKKTLAKFRAYDSYEDSFRDYAQMISNSPRYAQARTQTHSAVDYASSLQRAGYATDPAYAAKLSRAINTTLQVQRAQA
jgi:flagellar protein FlgJ